MTEMYKEKNSLKDSFDIFVFIKNRNTNYGRYHFIIPKYEMGYNILKPLFCYEACWLTQNHIHIKYSAVHTNMCTYNEFREKGGGG